MDVHAAAELCGRLRHERRARAAVERDLLDDLLGTEDAIGRTEGVGRHEVELDLAGRGLVAPRFPWDGEPVEAAYDLIHEAGDVVGIVSRVANWQGRADRRQVAIVRAARVVVRLAEQHELELVRGERGEVPRREPVDDT